MLRWVKKKNFGGKCFKRIENLLIQLEKVLQKARQISKNLLNSLFDFDFHYLQRTEETLQEEEERSSGK